MILSREFIENNSSLTAESVLNEFEKNSELWINKTSVSDNEITIDAREIAKFDKQYSSSQIIIGYNKSFNKFSSFSLEEFSLKRISKVESVEKEFIENSKNYSVSSAYNVHDFVDVFDTKLGDYANAIQLSQYIPFKNLLSINNKDNFLNVDIHDEKKTLGEILKDTENKQELSSDEFSVLAKEWFVKHNGEYFIFDGEIIKIAMTEAEINNSKQPFEIHCYEYKFNSYGDTKRVQKLDASMQPWMLSKASIGIINKDYFYDIEEWFGDLNHLIKSVL